MTAADFEYLSDYTWAAQWIANVLKSKGWAKTKGLVKTFLSRQIRENDLSFSQGVTDAFLDACN